MAERPSRDRRPGVSWDERSLGHQVVVVVNVLLILALAVALVIGWSLTVIWTLSGLAAVTIFLDQWLTWKLLGRLGRR